VLYLFSVISWKFSWPELEFPVLESNHGEERTPKKFVPPELEFQVQEANDLERSISREIPGHCLDIPVRE
jgi:hypothetical protein